MVLGKVGMTFTNLSDVKIALPESSLAPQVQVATVGILIDDVSYITR